MATPTNDLQTALASAGIEPEAAERLGLALERFMDEAVARQASSRDDSVTLPSASPDAERLARIEQSLSDMRELVQVQFDAVQQRFEHVDRRFDVVERRLDVTDRGFEEVNRRLDVLERRLDVIDRRFEEVERRFQEVDERLNRERLERFGFVTAATGAIVAGLLRLFGAI